MSFLKFEVTVRPTKDPGVTKAHADLQILLPNGVIDLIGFAIIKQPGEKPFVGFPQNRGRNKYFPVVKATGEIEDQIVKAILEAYKSDQNDSEKFGIEE